MRPILPTRSSWIDAAKAVPVAHVAPALGLTVRGRAFGPCPACNAERRESDTRRPPCGYGEGWTCYRCKVGGDALDLAARVLTGSRLRELPGERMGEVRAWYAARGWCDPDPGASRTASVPVPRRVPVAVPEPPPDYPPAPEVAALWEACRPVTEALRDEWAWLTLRRGLVLEDLAALDLVRLLPRDPAYPWPAWVPSLGMPRAEWLERYRFASPMYDATGALRSLRFRALTHVREPDPDAPGTLRWREVPMLARHKALATRGTISGLVLADLMGLALLRGERGVDGVTWDGRVVVHEGEPDLWTWATREGRAANGSTWASLGIVSGAWTEGIATRIPTGAKVAVRTHDDPDKTGDKYAERIRATLAERCNVRRTHAPGPREED